MRRGFRILFASFLLLFLVACSQKQPIDASDIDFLFSCKADVTSGGQTVSCSFCRMGAEDSDLQILSGGAAGMGYDWDGDGFTLTYQGLAAKSESCVLPDTSFESVLVRAVDAAAKPGTLTWTHGNEFSGTIGGDDFTLTVDPQTGQILTLTVPNMGVGAKFHDYQPIQS